jgi:hypothetical protein
VEPGSFGLKTTTSCALHSLARACPALQKSMREQKARIEPIFKT